MLDLTPDRLQAAFARRGYTWSRTDLNLLGVRASPATPTAFADCLVAAFVQPPPPPFPDARLFAQWLAAYGFADEQGQPLTPGPDLNGSSAWAVVYRAVGQLRLLAWPATTLPGSSWLQQAGPGTRPGLLLPGQYAGAYELTPGGLHQTGGPVRCAIGGALDAPAGPDGYFGIDIVGPTLLPPVPAWGAPGPAGEPDSPATDPDHPNAWNPGCQLLAHATDYAQLLRLCRVFAPGQGGRFTYTLLLEQELPPAAPAHS